MRYFLKHAFLLSLLGFTLPLQAKVSCSAVKLLDKAFVFQVIGKVPTIVTFKAKAAKSSVHKLLEAEIKREFPSYSVTMEGEGSSATDLKGFTEAALVQRGSHCLMYWFAPTANLFDNLELYSQDSEGNIYGGKPLREGGDETKPNTFFDVLKTFHKASEPQS
jgi:hypothetical protein